MENIKMWHHPKYYKELRKRNKTGVTATTKRDIGHSKELSFGFPPPVTSDQVISLCTATAASRRAPGSGLVCASGRKASSNKLQASSFKRQAQRDSNVKRQASSPKQQASSSKPQATSSMILDPSKSFKHL